MGMSLPSATPLTPKQLQIRSGVAKVGLVGAWAVIAVLVFGNLASSPELTESSAFNTVAGAAFALACVLWVAMVLEYIRERPNPHALLWGFLLGTGPVVGPLLFYYRVWRVRYRAALPNKRLEGDALKTTRASS
jgi:hypothetical protein